jgi:nickel/cobalt transporter (NicO) family protein
VTLAASTVVLVTTAASIALLHTAIGVDHTLPFVALGRSRGWSLPRTLQVTALCGLGHVGSSLLLAAVGIGLGVTLERLQWLQTWRGSVAAWLLIGFGSWLLVRALWRSLRGKVHVHAHAHDDGRVHSHAHAHDQVAHRHPHLARGSATVWTLFLLFAFGPCEPLIPLLMAPAAAHQWGLLALVAAVFAVVTVGTMLALVAAGSVGLRPVSTRGLERHADALAGATIALSGVAVQALGL